MLTARIVSLFLALFLSYLLLRDSSEPAPAARPASPSTVKNTLHTFHGLAIQVHDIRHGLDHYTRLINEVADLGANTVLLSTNGYQENISSSTIESDPLRDPSESQWLELFDAAHLRGLRIIFMPKILLRDPQDGRWRGQIQPPNWEHWFGEYQAFILPLARLAQRGRVDVFMVGSELVSTESNTPEWRGLITRARQDFTGLLSYSANWDHYSGIQFWNDLDLIGLTSYHDLNPSESADPTVEDLKAAWGKIQDRLVAWQSTIGRPLLFTEAGWCSQEGCSIEAWNYYRHKECTPAGLEEQKRCYEAFIATWADHPQVGGIIWWEWADPLANGDFGYTPKGKPAESVLRQRFGKGIK